jgi:hypothetical protein
MIPWAMPPGLPKPSTSPAGGHPVNRELHLQAELEQSRSLKIIGPSRSIEPPMLPFARRRRIRDGRVHSSREVLLGVCEPPTLRNGVA